VQAKILNQATLLGQVLGEPAKNLLAWAKQVKSGDSENLEARAAAFYWRNLFVSLPGFVREREEAAPNALLNYGYAILRAIVARALISCGLLPTLGIHHHNKYNAYCLADDIMEPYRPYVDQLVVELCEEEIPTVLTKELKEINDSILEEEGEDIPDLDKIEKLHHNLKSVEYQLKEADRMVDRVGGQKDL